MVEFTTCLKAALSYFLQAKLEIVKLFKYYFPKVQRLTVMLSMKYLVEQMMMSQQVELKLFHILSKTIQNFLTSTIIRLQERSMRFGAPLHMELLNNLICCWGIPLKELIKSSDLIRKLLCMWLQAMEIQIMLSCYSITVQIQIVKRMMARLHFTSLLLTLVKEELSLRPLNKSY